MSELWTVTLHFCGPSSKPVTLVYGSKDTARASWDRLLDGATQKEEPRDLAWDDYGTGVAVFAGGPIEVMVLQDCGRALEGGTELSLMQARGQARAQERANRDPVLKDIAAKQQQRAALQAPIVIPAMPPGKM